MVILVTGIDDDLIIMLNQIAKCKFLNILIVSFTYVMIFFYNKK